jgi:TrmH family RNA methyltransferase
MGSIARVNCYYCDLEAFLNNHTAPVYGACLKGTSYYTQNFDAKGVLVMGSESHGISPKIEKLLNEKITIPPTSDGSHAESLNVAMATAIILGEIYRP